ncbi:FadR/GntR family transcriptional regulator [Scandinavium sp. M-37]|uniref:FadR/GntR family transcriptional regulator n=1 Tax=Scandinavium sp. M-37 TaxID=3373077 RepID=UPI003747627E
MSKKGTEGQQNPGLVNDEREKMGVANWIRWQLSIGLLEERWKPSERLPPEAEICQKYDVSRNSYDHARKQLIAKGALEAEKGSGTWVAKDFHPYMLRDDLNLVIRLEPGEFSDMLEFRHTIELICASLAADRATGADLLAMSAALEAMKASQNDPAVFSRAECDFHFALIAATHSNAWIRAAGALRGDFLAFIAEVNEAGVLPQSVPAHEVLYQALKNRDPVAAPRAMATILALAKEASEHVTQRRKAEQDQQSRIMSGGK